MRGTKLRKRGSAFSIMKSAYSFMNCLLLEIVAKVLICLKELKLNSLNLSILIFFA